MAEPLAAAALRPDAGVRDPAAADDYTAAEFKFLIELARATLHRVALSPLSVAPDLSMVPARLQELRACFVTLTANNVLRGCIGQVVPREPLYQAVIHNAEHAALRDPRFHPVQPEEISQIQIELSILGELEPFPFASPEELLLKLRPHQDGVFLQIGARNATFLPQVWKQIPDKAEFLSQLCRKAGCESLDWRDNRALVALFRVQHFHESMNVLQRSG